MKKTLIITIVTLLIITLFSCNEKNIEKYIYFSAKIENPNSDTLSIKAFYGDTALINFNLKKGILNRDSVLLPMAYYRIDDKTETAVCFLKPGFDLNLSLNTKEFDESISYTGKGSAENNYLAEKYLLKENFGKLNYYGYYAKLGEEPFINLMDSLHNLELNLFNKYANRFDKDFLFIERKNIEVEYLQKYSDFEWMHKSLTDDKEFKVSKNFPNPYDSLNIDDEILLLLPNYINFINSYISKKTFAIYKGKDTLNYNNIFIDIVDTLIKNDKIKQEVASYFAKYIFSEMKEPEYCYNKLKSILTNKNDLQLINETYNKIKRISKGSISPSFQLLDVDSNLVKLEDFRGKIVYIDIWSIWCEPCIKEVPFLEKLEHKFKDKNIAFVSICKEDTRERWRKTVISNELSGIHLFAPNNNISFFKDYLVDGVPRFILIDKEGKIIDSDATRPSNKKTEEILTDLTN